MPSPTHLHTVYFGGGTPSLFTTELEPLFVSLSPYIAAETEITIEANPQDINRAKMTYWRDLGINRLSIGVQTFAPEQLKFLHRIHTAHQGRLAVSLAHEFFPYVSIDMIYGFPYQTLEELEHELDVICALPLSHISFYNLIYETGTPIGRAKHRGRLQPLAEEIEAGMYGLICERLAAQGYEHYEISNWAKEQRYSRHNLNYWQDGGYIGIGAGAHGYLPANLTEIEKEEGSERNKLESAARSGARKRQTGERSDERSEELESERNKQEERSEERGELESERNKQESGATNAVRSAAGSRYCYDRSERRFVRDNPSAGRILAMIPAELGLHVEHRTSADWLLEYLATGLRAQIGVDLKRCADKSRKKFVPVTAIKNALDSGTMTLENNTLRLTRREWFRENYWIHQLHASLS